jgi:hypothetical protein
LSACGSGDDAPGPSRSAERRDQGRGPVTFCDSTSSTQVIRRPGCGTLSAGGRSFCRARLPGWPRHVRACASCARLISVRASPSVLAAARPGSFHCTSAFEICSLNWNHLSGSTPMTYALRGARAAAAHSLAAPMARVIARMALAALGLPGDPVYEPVHFRGPASRPSCYCA